MIALQGRLFNAVREMQCNLNSTTREMVCLCVSMCVCTLMTVCVKCEGIGKPTDFELHYILFH